MSPILATSIQQQQLIAQLVKKNIPSYRQAYSDRTAWLMACLSELAYLKFNPLFKNSNIKDIVTQVSKNINAHLNKKLNKKNLAKISKLITAVSYEHQQEKKKLQSELSLLDCKLIETFDNNGTQAILVGNKNHLTLAFRGTEVTSMRDIKADLSANTEQCDSGGKIHSGFQNAFSAIALDVETTLAQKSLQKMPLFFTGHSLGGALAMVAAKKITHKGGNAGCYSFGSPRVGDANWVANIKTPIYRIVNAADFVTMLPPNGNTITIIAAIVFFIPRFGKIIRNKLLENLGGYIHGGNMRYLTNCQAKKYQDVQLLYNVSWFYRVKAFFLKKLPFTKPLADHSIQTYRKKCFVIAQRRNHK